MEPTPGLRAAIAAARDAQPPFLTGSDEQLLADLAAVEELGRIVDALRVAGAAEVEHRSRPTLGEERLSFRSGARDGAELVQRACRVGHDEAKRRVGLGCALAPKRSLLDEPLPGRYAPLADAVASGLVGLESARVIITIWKSIRRRVEVEQLDGMVVQLTDAAMVNDTGQLRDLAAAWAEILDPDGAEPKEAVQRRKRALQVGRTLADGTTRASLVLTPEHLLLLRELLQSRRRGVTLVRTEPGSDEDAETTGGEWREGEPGDSDDGDPRSRAQQDYDTLFETLEAGAKAEQADVAAQVTHETVVTITAAELQVQQGHGWGPGVLAGLPIPVVEQRMCTGGTRLLVLAPDGEPLHLGRSRRLFSPAQRTALMVAAGGRCQYPGCRTPAPFLEAHHAAWFSRDDGPTDVGNGIMLCSYHHHLIHAKHSPAKIVRHEDDLWIVPQWWTGPPLEHHRRQSGPLRDPRLDELRRRHDPDRNPWARPRAA
jgi:hypothetical protein